MLYRTSNGDVLIREFRSRDLAHVQNIDLKSYELQWDEDKWALHFDQTHVAVVNRRVVGFWTARITGSIIQILKLAVTPAFRRMKIGTLLLHDLIQSDLNAEYVQALIGESQLSALCFLRSRSFKITSKIPNYPVVGGIEPAFLFNGKIIRG